MSNYRFLLTRRWIILAVILAIASLVCLRLGIWQYDRHQYKVDRSEQIETYYEAAPMPLADDAADENIPAPAQWRTVEITGSFIGSPVLAPHRPVEGSAADHVLGIFQDSATGQYIAVNRGWFPTDVFSEPGELLELPTGEVTITAHVRSPEPVFSTTMAPGQVRSMNPGRIWQEATDHQPIPAELVENFYLEVGTDYLPEGSLINGHVRPDTGLGNHLSYAFQWWTFAIGCVVGYIVLARREVSDAAAEAARNARLAAASGSDPLSPGSSEATSGQVVPAEANTDQGATLEVAGTAQPKRRRRRKVGSQDSDEEDSLIDSQLG